MADSNDGTTVIGADTHIKGEMTFDGNAKILGRFEGTITTKGQLNIAEGASCKAQVSAGSITVDGQVEGNLTASDTVRLNAKSKLVGDLAAAKLVVAEGAAFAGQVQVGPDAVRAGGKPGAGPQIETTEAAKEPQTATAKR